MKSTTIKWLYLLFQHTAITTTSETSFLHSISIFPFAFDLNQGLKYPLLGRHRNHAVIYALGKKKRINAKKIREKQTPIVLKSGLFLPSSRNEASQISDSTMRGESMTQSVSITCQLTATKDFISGKAASASSNNFHCARVRTRLWVGYFIL